MKTLPSLFLPLGLMVLASAIVVQAEDQGGRARNKRIFIVPPPGPVAIDGRLDDWDVSGQIEVFVTQETAGTMSARIAAMFDEEALYLSGDFRDPTPMMNQHDPLVNAEKAWDADALQFRLVLDPKLGFPIHESSLDNPKPNPAICHMLMWYYTERMEPCLHLQYGMTYSPPKAGYPQCVVPRHKFQAAYRMADDGKGYSFEYRIPWTTLETPAPLKAGDAVASAIQIQWGAPDGLSSGGGGWAMDLMATGGFPFQSTDCWGRAIFTSDRHLPPEAREPAGENRTAVEPPMPLRFEYDLPQDGDVSVALLDSQGQLLRHVVAQAARHAGHVTENWDGLDDAGQPLAAGRYQWKGIVHDPIRTKHLLSVHNSGIPPYAAPDGTGAWGADHGRPSNVCAAGDHMILAWDGGEAGWSILRTDLQGRKQWGIKPGALFLATNSKERVFASGGSGFHDGQGVAEITGVATYFGTFHLFTRDGLYVAQLFKDQRLGETGPEVINAEAFAGQLVKLEKSGRYVLLAGDTDGRVTEVSGLETIRRFEGVYELTERNLQLAASARQEYARLRAQAQRLTVARGRGALDLAEPVVKIVDANRGFSVRAAYDRENLYVAYRVQSPAELVNAIPDPQIIFKGGNLIDIQIATHPGLDPKRQEPGPGDVRLLVSRQQGKTVAVLYRAKVAEFNGEPITLRSPTGQEIFDSIMATDRVGLEYRRIDGGFTAMVTIPREVVGWTQAEPGRLMRLDVGYLFGNSTGNRCAQRAYWSNNSPTANIIDDIPSESRLEPNQWGSALLE
ncbi:MAG: FlgD immunoglobulin-like domain containing protein [Verrucomicrobiia bacterium]